MIFETKTIQRDGFDVRIDVTLDEDAHPEEGNFTPEDIEAWKNDEWYFVGYQYTASKAGVELGHSSIWGSTWQFPDGNASIQDWINEDYYHIGLVNDAIEEARKTIAKLNV